MKYIEKNMFIERMEFPDTWEEFEKEYGFIDKEEIYTNGSRLIQSFRVKQWLEHIESESKNQKIENLLVEEFKKMKAEIEEVKGLRDNPYNNETEYSVSMKELRKLFDERIAKLKGEYK